MFAKRANLVPVADCRSWCLQFTAHNICCRWMEVLGSVASQSMYRNTVNGTASLPRSPKPPTPPPRYISLS